MSFNLIIFLGSFFVFLLAMIGGLGSFFERLWKWFSLMMVCVLLSGGLMFMELDMLLIPPPRDLPPDMPQSGRPLYP
jgi:hypothetical protein